MITSWSPVSWGEEVRKCGFGGEVRKWGEEVMRSGEEEVRTMGSLDTCTEVNILAMAPRARRNTVTADSWGQVMG